MRLKEKIISTIRNHNTVGVISDEIEKIVDDFATEFAEWILFKEHRDYIFKLNNGELRQFKKEKGLL